MSNSTTFSEDQIKILEQAQIIPPGTPAAIIKVFAQTCELHKLTLCN